MSKRGPEWAAGLFDGEGNVDCVGKRFKNGHVSHGRQISATVMQSTLERGTPQVLREFYRIMGVGHLYLHNRRGKDGRQQWTFSVHNLRDVQRVEKVLRPFLGKVKRAQFRIEIEKYRGAV